MTVVAIISDFGSRDWFVGCMKGVVLGINPQATIIDITNHIPQGDITAGAVTLKACFQTFPPGTVFLVVVDPGVGSNRNPLCASGDGYMFVGPDNGVLSFALQACGTTSAYVTNKQEYYRRPVSATFHGRDIFAPVAAHLSTGIPMQEIGTKTEDYIHLSWPEPQITPQTVHGNIIHVDVFGNAFTNISHETLRGLSHRPLVVVVGEETTIPILHHYDQQERGEPLALINSTGLLEIAVNCGNAGEKLGLRVGTPIVVE